MKDLCIFLDIDGVLNNLDTNKRVNRAIDRTEMEAVSYLYRYQHKLGIRVDYINPGNMIDVKLLNNLHKILNKFSSDIIIISSWFGGGLFTEKQKNRFNDILMTDCVVDGIPNTCGISQSRTHQALRYLKENPGKYRHALYLDDIPFASNMLD